jgi:hypothetical protein
MNGGAVPPLPYTSSWRRALLIKHRDNFPFSSFIPPEAISIAHHSHHYQQINTIIATATTVVAVIIIIIIISGQRPSARKILEPQVILS